MGFLASLLANVIVGFLKAWLATHEAEQRGADKQALDTERQANVKVSEANKARDAVKPLTANSLPAPNTDSDFRD